MPRLTVLAHAQLCPQGAILELPSGTGLCDALLKGGIHIEHACEQSCACTTCHVVVREGFDSLAEAGENEEDMLDKAWGLEATSRLSCQARMGTENLTIEIPKYTVNQVSEVH